MSSDPNSFWPGFVTAWNSHEAKSVASYFSTNAWLRFYDGRVFKYRAHIETFYRETFAGMPDDWAHSNPISEGTGTLTTGTFEIWDNQNSIITLHYELLLDTDGLIQNLTLTKP